MTGIERPWLWSLPTRVEVAEGAVIEFKEHGQPGVRFEQSQLDKLLEVGLMQPPRTSERDPDADAGVTLDGDARFLVGEVDLGREIGLEVLVRGLKAEVDASYRESRERHSRADATSNDEDSGSGEGAFDEPDLQGRSRESGAAEQPRGFAWQQTERVMPAASVIPKYKKIRRDVTAGLPVVLTDGGTRIAVIVGWDLWTLQHERYLYAAAMSWAFWRNGKFDAAGFGWEVLAYLRPPMQERLHPTVQRGEDGAPDEQPS